MGEHIVLGPTPVEVASQDFSLGYQEGYLRFTDHYQNKHLTDLDVFNFMFRNILDGMTTERYRAGYVMGWNAALHAQGRPGPMVGYYVADQQNAQVQA